MLRLWLSELFQAKMHKAGDDPELFQTYEVLLRENSRVVEEHIAELVGQLTHDHPIRRGAGRVHDSVRVAGRLGAGRVRRDGPLPRPGVRGGVVAPVHRGASSGRWWICC